MTIRLRKCMCNKEETTQRHPPIDIFTLSFGDDPLLPVGEEANGHFRSDRPIKAEKDWGATAQRPFDKVGIIMEIGNFPLCG